MNRLSAVLADVRSRTLLLVGVALIVGGVALAITSSEAASRAQVDQQFSAAAPYGDPGSAQHDYDAAQRQEHIGDALALAGLMSAAGAFVLGGRGRATTSATVNATSENPARRPCPDCGESIAASARICRF